METEGGERDGRAFEDKGVETTRAQGRHPHTVHVSKFDALGKWERNQRAGGDGVLSYFFPLGLGRRNGPGAMVLPFFS